MAEEKDEGEVEGAVPWIVPVTAIVAVVFVTWLDTLSVVPVSNHAYWALGGLGAGSAAVLSKKLLK